MEIRRIADHDRVKFSAIRREMFPGEDADWPVDEFLSPAGAAFGGFDGDDLVAYAAAGFRSHAEGAWEGPAAEQRIAYLEEWYVRKGHRHRGIGRALAAAVEMWALNNGATHLASDTVIGNDAAIAAHVNFGFDEVERTVHFIKQLPDQPQTTTVDTG